MTRQHGGVLLTLCSAAGFATLAIFIKLAYSAGANMTTVMTGRFVIAACLMWLTLALRGIHPKISYRPAIYMLLLASLFYVAMSSLFALSIAYLPAGLAGMILYTYPALVALLSAGIGDEALTKRRLLALAICFAGLFLTLGVTFQSVDSRGIWLGLGAAMVFATYIVLSNHILKHVNPLVASTYICTLSALLFVIFASTSQILQYNLAWSTWLTIVAISLFATYIGILCFLAGIGRIGAASASIISTVEPAITVVLSVIFLGESLTIPQICGGLLILVGILVLQSPKEQTDTRCVKV
jgi:drug/metabolite transporter (DMT)-like permease